MKENPSIDEIRIAQERKNQAEYEYLAGKRKKKPSSTLWDYLDPGPEGPGKYQPEIAATIKVRPIPAKRRTAKEYLYAFCYNNNEKINPQALRVARVADYITQEKLLNLLLKAAAHFNCDVKTRTEISNYKARRVFKAQIGNKKYYLIPSGKSSSGNTRDLNKKTH